MAKYIFDFDDVLFRTSLRQEERVHFILERAGVSRADINKYYERTKKDHYTMKKLLTHFALNDDSLYEEIMHDSKNFNNLKLIELVKKLGKSNCYIVSHGDTEFQTEKINRSEIAPFFSEIFIVPDSKKETIHKICDRHKDEKVFFIDDKIKYLEDIDLARCPNLETILYTGQNLEDYFQ